MHAMYNFLVNVGEDTDINSVEDDTNFGQYVEHKFDENNWYTPLVLAVKDGPVTFSEDTYRGGVDGWIDNRDEWDFVTANNTALDCLLHTVVRDLNLVSAPTNMDNPFNNDLFSVDDMDSAEDAARCIAEVLSGSYFREMHGERVEGYRTYCRPRLAKTYEAIRDEYSNLPFFNAWDFTPYTARNFDLTDGDDANLAILTVDVHT